MTNFSEQLVQTLEITKEEEIAAPIGIVFETTLEQLGPNNETSDGTPLPMKLEPWPGGRWFRDLENNSGHLWGHVQSIKPATLLEIYGPLFMSSAVISQVQFRFVEESGITRIKFSHRAIGQIAPEYRDGLNINKGWAGVLARIQKYAKRKESLPCGN